MQLNCTPIINLFESVAEPILLDHTQYEYPLLPLQREEDAVMEVENVEDVTLSAGDRHATGKLFYTETQGGENDFYYYARRKAASHTLSLSHLHLELDNATLPLLTARLACSQQDMTPLLSEKNTLQFKLDENQMKNIKHIHALTPLTPKRKWVENTKDYWSLFSFLSLKTDLMFQTEKDVTENFKKILMMHAVQNEEIQMHFIDTIQSLQCKPLLARTPTEPTSLTKGFAFMLVIAPRQDNPYNLTLLGSILDQFLKLQAPLNSFTILKMMTPAGEILYGSSEAFF